MLEGTQLERGPGRSCGGHETLGHCAVDWIMQGGGGELCPGNQGLPHTVIVWARISQVMAASLEKEHGMPGQL